MSNINVTGQEAYFNEDAKFFKDVYIYGTLYYEFESNVKEIFGDIEVNGSATFNGPAFFKRLNVSEYFSVGIGSTVISASALTGNVGINSVFPEQKLDILGSIKVDEFIYDSLNSPGENGYYLSRNEDGILWVGSVPSSSGGGILIQDEGDYIPIAGIAQSFTTLNFKQINSLGVGTDTIIPIPSPSNPTVIADIQSQDFWGFTSSGNIYRMTSVGIETANPRTELEVNGVLGFSDRNTRIGDNTTGPSITTGTNNNFIGVGAGQSTTTGCNNNFFGLYAGRNNNGGSYNNFFGDSAGYSNTTGCNNNFFGLLAGSSNTTGCHNNFLGSSAGRENTTGYSNNFFGLQAGYCNTDGRHNNFLGAYSGCYNTTGCHNNFLGRYAGRNSTTGCYNNFFGLNAGGGIRSEITSISLTSSTGLVGEAGNFYSDVPGTGGLGGSGATFNVERDGSGAVIAVNIATGGQNYNVGNTLTIDGAVVGGSSGTDDITITVDVVAGDITNMGCHNNFFGREAGFSNSSGYYNNFFGLVAGYYNSTGFNNNFLGSYAGYCNTGGCNNNFLGNDAGRDNTTGRHNNFSGNRAGEHYTIGYNNNFFGHNAGRGRGGIITTINIFDD